MLRGSLGRTLVVLGLSVFLGGFIFFKPRQLCNQTTSPQSVVAGLGDYRHKVLVFSAHEDDESIGAGGRIIQSVKAGADVRVVIVTDGDPRGCSALQMAREEETFRALALAGLPRQNVTLLRYRGNEFIFNLGATGLVRFIDEVAKVLDDFDPDEVYVHAYEHGHIEHDTLNYIVRRAFERSQVRGRAALFEYSEYHSDGSRETAWGEPLRDWRLTFDGLLYPVQQPSLTEEELLLKQAMAAQYHSQAVDLERCPKFVCLIHNCDDPKACQQIDPPTVSGQWTSCEQAVLDTYYFGSDIIRLMPYYDYSKGPCVNQSGQETCRDVWWNATTNQHNLSQFYEIVAAAEKVVGGRSGSISLLNGSGLATGGELRSFLKSLASGSQKVTITYPENPSAGEFSTALAIGDFLWKHGLEVKRREVISSSPKMRPHLSGDVVIAVGTAGQADVADSLMRDSFAAQSLAADEITVPTGSFRIDKLTLDGGLQLVVRGADTLETFDAGTYINQLERPAVL